MDNSFTNEIWLIRHGQSDANAGLPSTSPESIKLTPLGEMQGKAIERAIPIIPSLIVASSFLRSQQTAAPTLERFPQTQYELWPVQEFNYLAPEHYRGTTITTRRPLTREYWKRCDPDFRDGKGAETFTELFARVSLFLKRIRETQGLTLVFTHGQFMRAILWCTMSNFTTPTVEAMRAFSRFRLSIGIPNGAVLKVQPISKNEIRISNIVVKHLPSEWLSH